MNGSIDLRVLSSFIKRSVVDPRNVHIKDAMFRKRVRSQERGKISDVKKQYDATT